MLLKTALFNALYVKHLTYFLELAAAEYTTETAEGLKIWGGRYSNRRYFNDKYVEQVSLLNLPKSGALCPESFENILILFQGADTYIFQTRMT